MAISMNADQGGVFGPAVVYLGGATLGHTTQDGFEWKHMAQFTDVNFDYYGETPYDKVQFAESIEVSFTLGQIDAEVLSKAIPQATYNAASSPPLQVGEQAGKSMRDETGVLLIRPTKFDTGTPTKTHDLTIYKAFCTSEVTVPYKFKEQTVIQTTWIGLIDTSKDIGNVLWGLGEQP